MKKRIYLGIDPITGKEIRKRVEGKDEKEIEHKILEIQKERMEVDRPSDVTFGKYSQDWLKAYKEMRESATKEMYKVALNKCKTLTFVKVKDIRPLDLQLIINEHLGSPSSCRQLALTLKQIFKRAVKDGIIRRNPADDLQLPKSEKKEERALTDKEKEAIKSAPFTTQERMFVLLLFYFGLRPQEMLALMPQDFDLQNHELSIRRAVGYQNNRPYIKTTKTYKVRRIPIATFFEPDIKSFIREIKSENSLYLMHQGGSLLSKSQKVNLWNRIKEKINVQLGGDEFIDMTNNLRPYTFRHNFCCECYYKKVSIIKTAELMGNSPQMVMKVYTHLDNSREPLAELMKMSI
ncbi:MAG: tyrosine-type recombinase/integrase [Parasporobacterium sp.]|nr:tyrosine-type recombinase/integrase [Parasporobacterium sp.]